jgi:hypothetical protein
MSWQASLFCPGASSTLSREAIAVTKQVRARAKHPPRSYHGENPEIGNLSTFRILTANLISKVLYSGPNGPPLLIKKHKNRGRFLFTFPGLVRAWAVSCQIGKEGQCGRSWLEAGGIDSLEADHCSSLAGAIRETSLVSLSPMFVRKYLSCKKILREVKILRKLVWLTLLGRKSVCCHTL